MASRAQKCKELKDIFNTNLYEMQNLRVSGLKSVVKMNLLHKSNQNLAEKLRDYNCDVSYIPDCLNPPCITTGDATRLKTVLRYIKSPKVKPTVPPRPVSSSPILPQRRVSSSSVLPPKKRSRFRVLLN